MRAVDRNTDPHFSIEWGALLTSPVIGKTVDHRKLNLRRQRSGQSHDRDEDTTNSSEDIAVVYLAH